MQYRFWELLNGVKVYLKRDSEEIVPVEDRSEATLFTDKDWQIWGYDAGLNREEIGQDELMRMAGAPTLPGFEL